MNTYKRLRFTTEEDLQLLREVITHKPFENSSRWKTIKSNMLLYANKDFSIRTLREHVDYHLKIFIKENGFNRKKSGTEEQHLEKEMLLQSILDLSREFRNGKSSGKDDTDTTNSSVLNIIMDETNSSTVCKIEPDENEILSEEATVVTGSTTIADPLSTSNNNHKRKRYLTLESQDALTYLRGKYESEQHLKQEHFRLEEKRIKLDERKMALEEARFEVEKQERLQRLEMEARDKEAVFSMIKQQGELMSLMLKTFNK